MLREAMDSGMLGAKMPEQCKPDYEKLIEENKARVNKVIALQVNHAIPDNPRPRVNPHYSYPHPSLRIFCAATS